MATDSTYIRQFVTLKDEIEHGIIEAKSNIEFLSILGDTSAELKACTTTESVAQHLPKMMHLFRTIWLNSPYYNTHERIGNLFSALSNQIVVMCKDFIDLADVFAGKTRKSMKILEDCIKLCEDYRTLYHKVKNKNKKKRKAVISFRYFRSYTQFVSLCKCRILRTYSTEKYVKKILHKHIGVAASVKNIKTFRIILHKEFEV